ncbi:hypothetical protein [Lysinibacillus telephonicus]|uniref:Uncharacterized protein n=1 Tax=Lysinibacillus telephonicus TaxID=1714840 RepID=A0A431USC2_9BACI|nr:hypothetical protein [Lysinibacillus telephonicus]RTQ93323.1 hypothetical protein EKG35_08830 [Lysinibacillus telephonicus]
MRRKWIVTVLIAVIGVVFLTMYLNQSNTKAHPNVIIETQISPVDDKTYDSIGSLEYVKNPEKDNFKLLKSLVKVTYPKNVQNVEIEFSKTYKELLGDDIYWTGEIWEYPHPDDNTIEHYHEIIIYTGETNEQQLKDMLSKGTMKVTWKENEKVISEKHTLDEAVLFKK